MLMENLCTKNLVLGMMLFEGALVLRNEWLSQSFSAYQQGATQTIGLSILSFLTGFAALVRMQYWPDEES